MTEIFPCVGGARTNENDCRQTTAFSAWPTKVAARRQFGPPANSRIVMKVCGYVLRSQLNPVAVSGQGEQL